MEKRFYVLKDDIANDEVTLCEDEHQHLSKVLRLRVGDNVECFEDGGNILSCQIVEISKNSTKLKVIDKEPCLQNPKINLTLFQGLPKLDKLEFITQKVTELGVKRIIPFSSKFCIAKENLNKIERLNKIVISACKQCGRTLLTEIVPPKKFDEMLKVLCEFDVVLFANECEKTMSLKDVFNKVDKKIDSVAIIVGSEGGFSKEEIERLESLKNVFSVSLGKRILRTETASVSLSSLVLYELGEI